MSDNNFRQSRSCYNCKFLKVMYERNTRVWGCKYQEKTTILDDIYPAYHPLNFICDKWKDLNDD